MISFKEEILHYIFQYKLFAKSNLKTTTGEPLEIIKTGTLNQHSGPDFFNALIKIGNVQFAGNIEIHINASDWHNHNHQLDAAYNNIILHVVYNNDKIIFQNNAPIATLELKQIVDDKLFNNYEQLLHNKTFVPCAASLKNTPELIVNSCLDRMLAERMEDKASMVLDILKNTNNSWEETFYHLLAYSFGFGVNKHVFLKLAQTLPLNILAKHKNNLMQIEALVFGTAGFLSDFLIDDYSKCLQNEYQFLKTKYQLNGFISKHEWKFSKMHPSNFPSIRLAQFSKLIFQSSHLFSKIINCKSAGQIQEMFTVNTSDYWQNHYTLDKQSVIKTKMLGQDAIDSLLINTVVPALYVYSKANEKYRELAMNLLIETKPEKNNISKVFVSAGIKSKNAYQTQALLHLKNNYCEQKKCLQCAIGNYLIKN